MKWLIHKCRNGGDDEEGNTNGRQPYSGGEELIISGLQELGWSKTKCMARYVDLSTISKLIDKLPTCC